MKSIPIILKIHSIMNEDIMIETSGFIFNFNKLNYLVTVHQGLPVKEIQFNVNDTTHRFDSFTICGWNDLLIQPIDTTISDLFVFKHFVKKQINVSCKYYINMETNVVKYIENEFFPINMIPGNPSNLYYCMKTTSDFIKDGDAGKPVYCMNNKLIGITCKVKDNMVYVIPSIYLLKSIMKTNNTNIYTLNTDIDNIKKIGRYNVKNNNISKIYYQEINSLIPIESFIVLEGDVDKLCNILQSDKMDRRIEYTPFINNNIINNMNLIIKNKVIHITSSFVHLIKIYYKDISVIKNIFNNMESKTRFEYMIKDTIYYLSFI